MKRLKWKADFEKNCLLNCFDRRGWEKAGENDNDWNIYWANVMTIKQLFGVDTANRLRDDQIVNHFPNHVELTRKDMMVKNFKRYKKDVDKENFFDCVPQTYVLPSDYSLFVEEFKKCPNSIWIMKPAAKARGIGIFMVSKLSQLRKWSTKSAGGDPYVISKYVDRPLLIGGKKFDLRLYVLVTSYRPLQVFFYREGFARFCNENYSHDFSDKDNHFMHLTNVSVQKTYSSYNNTHGGKWSIANLRLYLNSTFGTEATSLMFQDIELAILHSVKSVRNIMINDKHSFECYGYDLLIDENLTPWLLEVNASPALTATTANDKRLKASLINNVFNIVTATKFQNLGQDALDDIVASSNFITLYDEASNRPLTVSATRHSQEKWR